MKNNVKRVCFLAPRDSREVASLYKDEIFFTAKSKVRIGCKMADDEDHPDSSGKEVIMIFFIFPFSLEADRTI